ncbi:MAG: acyl carrier protein [Alphaproteobacteria bacterium]|nr:acyl carrier protein [Alphaproteobacteria bacterium]
MSTFDKVQAIIVEKLGVPKEKVTMDAEFIADLGADSLDTVEFIMDVEKEFNITIPDDAAAKMKKVKDAVDYIDAHSKPAGGAKAPEAKPAAKK